MWELKLSSDGKKLYRKEILRTGQFKKASDGIDFEVDELFLNHLHATHKEMTEDGVKVSVPLGHDDSGTNNKGWLVGTEREGESLFGLFDINGVTGEELKNYDVSAYIPPKFVAGNGKTYVRPLRHVALTSCPVITGLDSFEAVVASLVSLEEESSMPVDFAKLGTDLGIEEEMSEETAPELILSFVAQLKKELQEAKKEDKTTKKSLEELQELALSHPGLIKIARQGRIAQIEGLLKCEQPKINKAVRDELEKIFCSDEALVLALEDEESDFDRVVKALEKNALAPLGESTRSQTLELSDSKKVDKEPSPLMADVERRKKALSN